MENPTLTKSKFFAKDYADYDSAMSAYDKLKTRGYSDSEIALIMSEETKNKYHNTENHPERLDHANKTMESSGIGSAIGGVVGASAAAIAAIGTSLLIPGLGLVVAGPIAAALAGAGAGGLSGGLVGALVGAGMNESEAKHYDEKVKSGNIVVGVTPKSEEDEAHFNSTFI